jgi:hypothetical protein
LKGVLAGKKMAAARVSMSLDRLRIAIWQRRSASPMRFTDATSDTIRPTKAY